MSNLQNRVVNSATSRIVVLLTSMLSCFSATANADEAAFTMTTIIDSAYGSEIVAGEYERAIEKIASSKAEVEPFFTNTNLCVAYTKTGNVDDALVVCEKAVDQAVNMSFERRGVIAKSFQKRTKRNYVAIALANRGVLRATMGDVELARQDFSDSLKVGVESRLRIAKANLAKLEKVEAQKV